MNSPIVAPYGSWKSPIQAADLAAGTLRLSEVLLDGQDVYWIELRPTEGGRCVIVRRGPDGAAQDVNPPPFNARTRVHEYGGGSYLPVDGSVFFVHFADQRLYRVSEQGAAPVAVTPPSTLRYADFIWDRPRNRLLTVIEDHTSEPDVVNSLAAVYPDEGGRCEVLVHGNDFYSAPRLSGDGSRLAWLTWNHPDMPWDANELWTAPVRSDGTLALPTRVAGGPGESIAQPEWSPDGVLYFASDRTDWWNLYRWREGRIEPVTQLDAEFASPQWVFRMSNYGFDGRGRILCACFQDGRSFLSAWRGEGVSPLRLAGVSPAVSSSSSSSVSSSSGSLRNSEEQGQDALATPYDSIGSVRASGGRAVFLGASATRAAAVVSLDLATGRCEELRRSSDLEFDAGYLSVPQAVEFPTEGGLTAHGLFYAPKNKDFAAPAGEKPPLVVMVHGGPTSATLSALRLGIQYYTSRGLAVLDVNYGGSSGYGRKYRRRLEGNWGVVDVDDCCNGAKHLAARGLVDGRRMAITGGSAGGYTVLAALTMRKVFAAGASHYGVSDCEALATETHKFESRYLDRLIGPYPQRRDLYVERSPIHHVEGLSCPVIFFQGLEDKIVPPNQARTMADALRKKGLPVALVEFEGEQHGFRQAAHIRRATEGELYFFSRVFGFSPADHIEPVPIENL